MINYGYSEDNITSILSEWANAGYREFVQIDQGMFYSETQQKHFPFKLAIEDSKVNFSLEENGYTWSMHGIQVLKESCSQVNSSIIKLVINVCF